MLLQTVHCIVQHQIQEAGINVVGLCKSITMVTPVDEAVADHIAALNGECVLAFSFAPSDKESSMHLHIEISIRQNAYEETRISWSNLIDKHRLCSWSVNIRHQPGFLIVVRQLARTLNQKSVDILHSATM